MRTPPLVKPEFVLFGADHLSALACVAIFSILAYIGAQGARAEALRVSGGSVFAFMAIALWGFRLVDGFQAQIDLPLSLCDVAFLLCVLCFFRPQPWALVMVVYWGLAGTLQALITPDLLQGFPSKEYFLFFVGHAIIVIGVFFLIGKNRHLELGGFKRAGQAFLGLLVYTLSVGLMNLVFDWNYGYLRSKPDGASVLDMMGPWPWYVFGGLAFALMLFLLIAGLLRFLPKSRS